MNICGYVMSPYSDRDIGGDVFCDRDMYQHFWSVSECACRFVGYGCRNDGIYDDCGDEIDSSRQVCSIFHPVSKNAVWSMQWMQLTVDGIDSSSSKVSNLHVIFPSMQDRWMQWSERN